MAVKTVAIRYKGEGGEQVVKQIMVIGDAGEQAAKKWRDSFTRAGADGEAAARRQAAALEKLNALGIGPDPAALNRVTDAQGKLTSATNRSGAAFASAAPQIQDFIIQATMGGNVIQALVVQGGQLAGQLIHVEGRVGAVATALMGPWGIAAQVALMVFAPFVGKLLEGGDAANKLKSKVETLADALSKERFGTEQATKAIQDYNAAKAKAADTDSLAIDQSLKLAEARLREALALREVIKAQMDKALADEGAARGLGGGALLAVVNNGSGALNAQDAKIALLNQTLSNLYIDKSAQAEKLVDRVAAINNQYARQRDAAIRAARGNVELSKALEGTRQGIERARQAALQAERERQQAAQSTRRDAEALTSTQVANALRGEFAGIQITSTDRSTAKQAQLYARYKAGLGPLAAPPGSSYHEKGQAVDVAKSAGLTQEALQRFFDLRDIQVKILDEGRHFHVQWTNGKNALAEWADAAKRAKEEAEQLTSLRLFTDGNALGQSLAGVRQAIAAQGQDFNNAARSVFGADLNGNAMARVVGEFDQQQRVEVDRWNAENARRLRKQEDDYRYLGNLWSTVFTGGTKGVWDMFRQQGLQVISELLARWMTFGNVKGATGAAGSFVSTIGTLFGGTTSIDMTKTNAMLDKLIVPRAYAVGTYYSSAGAALVGENGPELVNFPRGSRVTPAAETRRMLNAGNDNRPAAPVHYHFTGNLMTPEFWAMIQQSDDLAAARGAAGGATISRAESMAQGARRLGRSWR